MSKLDELIQEYCPDGVEYKKLGELAIMQRGTSITKKNVIEGNIPVISGGKEPAYYCNVANRNEDIITVAGSGAGAGYVRYWNIPIFVCDAFSIKGKREISTKYLYYYLENIQNKIYATKKGGGVPHVHISSIENFLIPVPPLEVQQEIVRILDNFTDYTEKLKTELDVEITARKKQYEYYRDKLLTFDVLFEGTNAVKQMAVGDVATVTKLAGFEFTKYVTYSDTGKVIALRGLNVKNGRLDLTNVKYIDNSDLSKLSRSKLYIGDMLFTYVGTIGQVALISENDKYYLAPNVALIRCDKNTILPEYMLYYFQSNYFISKQINKYLQSSSMQNLTMENIRKFEICIPSLETQKRIVHVLDNFEKICSDLNIGLPAEIEARQKQYEYYRDALLTFAAKGDIIVNRTEQNRTEQNRTEQNTSMS